MKTMKRIFITLCLMSTLSGFAQTWNIGSSVLTNVTATLENGTLTISGTGLMKNFGPKASSMAAPWLSYSITNVVIENGVTSIGSTAFEDCSDLISVIIPV